jgi:hypothetical protein
MLKLRSFRCHNSSLAPCHAVNPIDCSFALCLRGDNIAGWRGQLVTLPCNGRANVTCPFRGSGRDLDHVATPH